MLRIFRKNSEVIATSTLLNKLRDIYIYYLDELNKVTLFDNINRIKIMNLLLLFFNYKKFILIYTDNTNITDDEKEILDSNKHFLLTEYQKFLIVNNKISKISITLSETTKIKTEGNTWYKLFNNFFVSHYTQFSQLLKQSNINDKKITDIEQILISKKINMWINAIMTTIGEQININPDKSKYLYPPVLYVELIEKKGIIIESFYKMKTKK